MEGSNRGLLRIDMVGISASRWLLGASRPLHQDCELADLNLSREVSPVLGSNYS